MQLLQSLQSLLVSVTTAAVLAVLSLYVQAYRLKHCAEFSGGMVYRDNNVFSGTCGTSLTSMALHGINGWVTELTPLRQRKPFLNWKLFVPEIQPILTQFNEIRREVATVVQTQLQNIPQFGEVDARNQGLSFHDKKAWRTLVFRYHTNQFAEHNCKLCPTLSTLLKQMPALKLSMLSILEPGKRLYPHQGPYRGILRLHIPIIVPPHNKSWIRVGDTTHYWREAQPVLFDDTFEHEVLNLGLEEDARAGVRVVLFADILRPLPCVFEKLLSVGGHKYFSNVNKQIETRAKG